MKRVKIKALGGFSTADASGTVTAKQGEVIEVFEHTAVDLIKRGFAEKWRPEKKGGNK